MKKYVDEKQTESKLPQSEHAKRARQAIKDFFRTKGKRK